MLCVEFYHVLGDGVGNLVHHYLLLFGHFLLLAHYVLLVVLLLLLELLILGLGHGSGEEALVHLVLEFAGVFFQLFAAAVNLCLDAGGFGFEHGGEVVTTDVVNIPGSANIRFDEDGAYFVEASAVDMAGNRSEKIVTRFYIDTKAPTVSIEGIWENVDIKGPANISVDVSENMYSGTTVDITLYRTILQKTEKILPSVSPYDL